MILIPTLNMDELTLIYFLSYVMIAMGFLTFYRLTNGNKSPYGRYVAGGGRLRLNPRLAWFLQELPSFAVPLYFLIFTSAIQYVNIANKLIVCMFLCHYFQR